MQTIELPRCIEELSSEAANRKQTYIFFGAGAARDERLPAELQLPLGQDVKMRLLRAAFSDRTLTENDLEQKFRTNFSADPTPDTVWQKLVTDRSSLSTFYKILHDSFGVGKPIPSTYYMLAHWFLTFPNVGGIGTTNFDEKIDDALEHTARSLGMRLGVDYHVASLVDDFHYIMNFGLPLDRTVQKVHGTFSRPRSIRAGVIPRTKNRDTKVQPYQVLQLALSKCKQIIFLGYSFRDTACDALLEAAKKISGLSAFVIDLNPSDKLKELEKSSLSYDLFCVKCSAEDFLNGLLSAVRTTDPIQATLPELERRVLRKGPKYMEGCKARQVTATDCSTRFFDVVHGHFNFSPEIATEILQFVDTGEIQRLRSIKQLSFVHLKFPAASHDRFSHSLGVAHLADEFFCSFMKSNRDDEPLFRFPESISGLRSREHWLAFCLAALLHDAGHGPLGHTMDVVRFLMQDGSNRHGEDKGLEHELETRRLYTRIIAQGAEGAFADLDLAQNSAAVAPNEVLKILTGEHQLSPLLDNPGLDLDRMDFIFRDAWTTLACVQDSHTTWRDRLVELRGKTSELLKGLILVEPSQVSGTWKVAFERQKYEETLYELGGLYVELYNNVYNCWQNASAQAMIAIAVEEILRSRRYSWQDILLLTDVELLAILENFENYMVRELACLVKYRRLYDFCFEIAFTGEAVVTPKDIYNIIEWPQSRRLELLVSVKPSKMFSVLLVERLSGNVTAGDCIPAMIKSAPTRIMFFKWPGSKVNNSALRTKVIDYLELRGCSIISEVAST